MCFNRRANTQIIPQMTPRPEQSNISPLCQSERSLTRMRVNSRPLYARGSVRTVVSDFLWNLSNRIEAMRHRRLHGSKPVSSICRT